ncbi:MAG: hypothetical protein NUV53_02230 [Patescibacteria group bacterium]|nr:hypothetical protein [Patescibacteria group bacterium]
MTCGNKHKSGIVVSLLFLIFFSYGPISQLLIALGHNLIRIRHVVGLCIAIFCIGTFAVLQTRKNLDAVERTLTITSFFLTSIVVLQLSFFGLQYFAATQEIQYANNAPTAQGYATKNNNSSPVRRDVYYLLLDGYARYDTIEQFFGYSNKEFYDFLGKNKFSIANKSTSNYSFTLLSLASSLNMEYLDDLTTRYSPTTETTAGNTASLRVRIENNALQHFFKSNGYKFVYVSSGSFAPTSRNNNADINLSWDISKSSFGGNAFLSSFLYEFSMLRPLYMENKLNHSFLDTGEGVLYAFDSLERTATRKNRDPLFAFAHILAPHPPFTLNNDCMRIPPRTILTPEEDDAGYVSKLICTNKLLENLITTILDQPGPAPIIVLQSDHGFTSSRVSAKDTPSVRMRNFTALYLPDGGENIIYPSITPVNIFPRIFNYYFDTEFPSMKDSNFYMPSEKYIYDLRDITEANKP